MIIMHVQGQNLDEFIEISPVVEISEDHLFLVNLGPDRWLTFETISHIIIFANGPFCSLLSHGTKPFHAGAQGTIYILGYPKQ